MRSIATTAAAALLLAGCRIDVGGNGGGSAWSGDRVQRVDELTLDPAGATVLEIEAGAGSIDLSPNASGSDVRVVATVQAPTDEDLRRVSVVIASSGGVARVGYAVEGSRDGISVSFEVSAPPSLEARLRSGAGSVRVHRWESAVRVRTEAGSVSTDGVRGDQDLESGAGSVRASDAEGCVRAQTSAGSIRVGGRLRGDCIASSGAGSVTVVLPADARLRLSGKTSAGSIRSDFPVAVRGEFASKSLDGVLGDGAEGSLRIESSAGSLRVLSTAGELVIESK
jgi:hypothetical protein